MIKPALACTGDYRYRASVYNWADEQRQGAQMGGQGGHRLHKQIRDMPVIPTSFFGREHELAELARHLQDPACRLLTVFGPGDIGKTRLALEVAARQVADFADGVCSSRRLRSQNLPFLNIMRSGAEEP